VVVFRRFLDRRTPLKMTLRLFCARQIDPEVGGQVIMRHAGQLVLRCRIEQDEHTDRLVVTIQSATQEELCERV